MNNGIIRLLYVEDDLVDQMAFKRMVREQGLSYELTIANSIKSAHEIFANNHFDVVICDFQLGDGNSIEILPEIISTGIPAILVTGTGDEDLAVKAIKLGASDYVIKDNDNGHLKVLPLIVENALRNKNSEERIKKLSMAVDQSPGMVFITDSKGFIEYVNPSVTEITGYQLTDFRETDLFSHHTTHNPETIINEITDTVTKHKKWQGITRHERKSGELYWESTTISPIYDNDNHFKGYIKVSEDITEKKKAEEAIKKYSDDLRESNASKDKMFSIIAHDLRTPFNGLMAFSDILSNDFDSLRKEEVIEYIQVIRDLSRNTFNLLEKLLQWSRLQTGRMDFVPANLLISDQVNAVINLLSANAMNKGIELRTEIEPGLTAFADPDMLNAVIRNITSNAIKFTPEQGIISITAGQKPDKTTEICIADTGIGMSAGELEKLFRVEYHYSSKGTKGESGTGLGLLLCKEFVERNAGKISVESEPGKGSRFIINLPGHKD